LQISTYQVGVLEAAGVGFGFAFLVLLNGILKRHPDAMTALVGYGRMAIVVGLVVGLILRLVAILALKLYKPTDGVGAGSEQRSVA
jgi:hypothetical protein